MNFVRFAAEVIGYLCIFVGATIYIVYRALLPSDLLMQISRLRLSKASTALLFLSMTGLSLSHFLGGNLGIGFLFALFAVVNVFSYLSDRKKLKELWAKWDKELGEAIRRRAAGTGCCREDKNSGK
jgi:hypothetical protein